MKISKAICFSRDNKSHIQWYTHSIIDLLHFPLCCFPIVLPVQRSSGSPLWPTMAYYSARPDWRNWWGTSAWTVNRKHNTVLFSVCCWLFRFLWPSTVGNDDMWSLSTTLCLVVNAHWVTNLWNIDGLCVWFISTWIKKIYRAHGWSDRQDSYFVVIQVSFQIFKSLLYTFCWLFFNVFFCVCVNYFSKVM